MPEGEGVDDNGLQISVTNEFDANLSSIIHRLTETPLAESAGKSENESASATIGFSSQMSQVKRGLTSVVDVALPSQLIRQQRPKNAALSTSTAKVQEESKQGSAAAGTNGTTAMQDNDSSLGNNSDD